MAFPHFKKPKTVHEARNRQRIVLLVVILVLLLVMGIWHWEKHHSASLCELQPSCGPEEPK